MPGKEHRRYDGAKMFFPPSVCSWSIAKAPASSLQWREMGELQHLQLTGFQDAELGAWELSMLPAAQSSPRGLLGRPNRHSIARRLVGQILQPAAIGIDGVHVIGDQIIALNKGNFGPIR